MKNLCKLLSFLILILSIHLTAFAQESEVDIAVTAFNADGEAFGEVTIYIYSLDEETGEYQQSETGFMTNSDTLTNNIPVALGATFYAKGFDAEGNVYQYSDDPDNDNNIWTILSENVIENVDTGETRIPYVEIYPSSESINTNAPDSSDDTASDDTASDDTLNGGEDPEEVEEIDTTSIDTDISEYDLFELDVTILGSEHEYIESAAVYVHVDGLEDVELFPFDTDSDGIVDSEFITTDNSGKTNGLNIPIGYQFYVFALSYDTETVVGTTYGGTFDTYYNRANYWISYDGETMQNVSTGQLSPTSLILHPGTLVPWDIEEGELDPATYLCGDFEDAIYSELNFEECEAIEYVKELGIFTGTDEGLLEPFRAINRAEVTKVMVEYFDVEIIADISEIDVFPDVSMYSWYTNYVYTAKSKNIVGGYPDGYFRPENSINRVEMLRILTESSGVTDEDSYLEIPEDITYYNDIEVNPENLQWYLRYANYAFLNNLIENDGNLYPSEDMTRMDVIKLLYRASLI